MLRIASYAPTAAIFLAASIWPGMINAELIKGYPDALVCSLDSKKFVVYIHQIQDDGSAIFMDQGGQYVTWKKDGTVIRNNKPFPGCRAHTFSK